MSSYEKKPQVVLTSAITACALSRLQQKCQIINYDTAVQDIQTNSFDAFRKCVAGVDAILTTLSVRIDSELLDAAGE